MRSDDSSLNNLVRVLGATTSTRESAGAVIRVAAIALGMRSARGALRPAAAFAAETCEPVRADGTCPDDKDKRSNGNEPTANGCGPEGGSIKIPQKFGWASFTPACDAHDICYEDCVKSKSSCDNDFRIDPLNICHRNYPWQAALLVSAWCWNMASIYADAVTFTPQSHDAWAAAQQKACECCGNATRIYCNCNQKCYDDIGTCQNECMATMACFTGICEPARPGQCD
jgi:hypothetical protein